MSIKFVCSCGQHLKARDEMARRRTVCPRCGHPVGIPAREPHHPGGAAPLTILAPPPHDGPSAEPALPPRPRHGAAPTAAPADDPVGQAVVCLLKGLPPNIPPARRTQPPPARRPLTASETLGFQCLLDALHNWRWWLPAAVAMTLLTGVAVLFLLPQLLAEPPQSPRMLWLSRALYALGLVLALGYPCHFLGAALRSAAAGEGQSIDWPANPLVALLKSGATWLVCFLAGPVVPVGVGLYYWLRCGEPTWVDWLILAELGVWTVGHLLLALAAVSEQGRLRDANPLHVIDLAHRLRYRAVVVTLLGSALALAHGWLAVVAARELHQEPAAGWLLLAVCWVSGMFWTTFLVRLLGTWCQRSRAGKPC